MTSTFFLTPPVIKLIVACILELYVFPTVVIITSLLYKSKLKAEYLRISHAIFHCLSQAQKQEAVLES